MSFIPKLSIPTIFQYKPSTKLGATSGTPAPAKSGDRASHGALYNSKRGLPAPPTISHKNHRHIDDTARAEISAIDQEIQAAFSHPDEASSIAAILTKLLDKPFFQPANILNEEMDNLFAELDKCPINPKDGEAGQYAKTLIQGYSALQKKYNPEAGVIDKKEEGLEQTIKDYLKSNRSTKANFERQLASKLNVNSGQRGSAQKMALETFTKAFPLIISNDKNDQNHLTVLKKLIDTLPNLEHHAIIERNAQRRGLRVLEKALGNLPSNEVAEILGHQMNGIADLSQELSRHTVHSMGGAVTLIGKLASDIFLNDLGAARLERWKKFITIEKQPQGTALYMLKDQLTKLRKDWDNVTPDNRQKLIKEFKNLQTSYNELLGTKKSTLQRFFNDSFIDPSKFQAKPNSTVELRKRFHHSAIAPLTSRLKPVTNLSNISDVPGYATATTPQKELVDLLVRFHTEAKRAGVPVTKFPAGFLENFIDKTRAPEFENAASIVLKSFSRVTEMPEYRNQNGKVRLLSQIVEMTNRLAVGDETFVQDFVSTCRLADENCHNNARQIFKAQTYSVIADKALKGEEGLNDNGKLLTLARSFFNEQELKAATRELITHNEEAPFSAIGIEVEVGNAVEIALGRKFGIPDPIQGMGYTDMVTEIVTPERLELIQDNIEKRISKKDAFIGFLEKWTPLTKKIKEDPAFHGKVDEKISDEEYEKFEQAQNTYFAIKEAAPDGKATKEQEMAFEAAGAVFISAKNEVVINVVRAEIESLVDSHTAGWSLGDEAMSGSASANTNIMNSANADNEIQETL